MTLFIVVIQIEMACQNLPLTQNLGKYLLRDAQKSSKKLYALWLSLVERLKQICALRA